ncbi:MAG: hypothetical protein ACLFS4_08850 [Opitutales bacterium]
MEFAHTRLRREGASNTEWIETGLKAALFADARGMVESLLNDPQVEVAGAHKLTGEKRGGMQEKTVQSMFGSIRLRREYFYHPGRGCGRYPLDEALGLENGYTPAAVRLMCRAGARDVYEEGSADLLAYAGLEISAQEINRMVQRIGPQMRSEMEAEKLAEQAAEVPRLYVSCDGTGVPMRRSELVGVKGKGADGKASTREVKVGCVFTQHPKEGEDPFRDTASTSYIATLRKCGSFGPLLRKEACRRGMGRAEEIVFIADGAAWIWETARTCFSGAVEILDYYHAHEYLVEIIDLLYGKNTELGKQQIENWKDMLFEDRVSEVIAASRALAADLGTSEKEIADAKINYLVNNQTRMLYGSYKRKGYFYGSGVIEAGCKSRTH